MSRYVHIELRATTLDAVEAALRELDLPFERPRRRVRLQGSLECTGDPVDLRLASGVCDTVEDFGFAVEDGVLRLVCGELDQSALEETLLPPLRQAIATATVRQRAAAEGLTVRELETEPGGTRRLVLELDE